MTRDAIIEATLQKGSREYIMMEEIVEEQCLDINEDFEEIIDQLERRLADEDDYDDSMDGDHESAFVSIGWGTDEDYNPGEML